MNEMPAEQIHFLGDMKKVTMGPNDIGVIVPSEKLSMAQRDRLQHEWASIVGSGRKLLILDPGWYFGVIERG